MPSSIIPLFVYRFCDKNPALLYTLFVCRFCDKNPALLYPLGVMQMEDFHHGENISLSHLKSKLNDVRVTVRVITPYFAYINILIIILLRPDVPT